MRFWHQRAKQFLGDGPSLRLILGLACLVRIIAAILVESMTSQRQTICLFGDTSIYWQYALSIAKGTSYVVYQWDVPHYALRTPGYPIWLAGWIWLFGEITWPIRMAQVVLGVVAVMWVYRLSLAVKLPETSARYAALIAAVDPFQTVNNALLLTESIFTPLLVAFLLCWIRVLDLKKLESNQTSTYLSCFCLGGFQALLALIRPSWGPFLMIILATQIFRITPEKSWNVRQNLKLTTLILTGWLLMMTPWAMRNMNLLGRPALGGTWGGASLYDGVGPLATGASDMRFVADPLFRDLPEVIQDDLWKELSYDEIQKNPQRILSLSFKKLVRFWSAWPMDSGPSFIIVKLACALVVWPVWFTCLVGFYSSIRARNRYVLLVVLPLIFTMLEHLIFVGSSRYRIAVFLPVLIFSGHGLALFLKMRGVRNQKF